MARMTILRVWEVLRDLWLEAEHGTADSTYYAVVMGQRCYGLCSSIQRLEGYYGFNADPMLEAIVQAQRKMQAYAWRLEGWQHFNTSPSLEAIVVKRVEKDDYGYLWPRTLSGVKERVKFCRKQIRRIKRNR